MNAQEVIDSVQEPTDFFQLFYPREYERKLVDSNITKILKELK